MIRQLANFFKALGDETRLKILRMLLEKELCVCEIIDRVELSQPAVSHHLKILRQAGLVKDSKEGKWVYYSMDDEAFIRYGEAFEQIFAQPVRKNYYTSPKRQKAKTDYRTCERLTAKRQTPLNFRPDE